MKRQLANGNANAEQLPHFLLARPTAVASNTSPHSAKKLNRLIRALWAK